MGYILDCSEWVLDVVPAVELEIVDCNPDNDYPTEMDQNDSVGQHVLGAGNQYDSEG
jgi:hypothetical protein